MISDMQNQGNYVALGQQSQQFVSENEGILGKAILAWILGAIFVSIIPLVILKDFSSTTVYTALGILFASLTLTLIVSILFSFAVKIIYKKRNFAGAWTAISYGFFVLALGLLIVFLIELLPSSGSMVLEIVKMVLSFLILVFTIVISVGATIRAATELLEIDVIGTVILLSIIYGTMAFAVYFIMFKAVIVSFVQISKIIGAVTSGGLGNLGGAGGSTALLP